MQIAFHAPLKPPDAPNPSGDRTMARLLVQALERGGHHVEIGARLRSRDGSGDPTRQARLQTLGARLADRFVRRVHAGLTSKPDLWFTYHLYYKAPDWIGPRIADALSIPYVVAEASVAHKRAGGPWDLSHRAVVDALGHADLVIGLNSRDRVLVEPEMRADASYLHLLPFLDPPKPAPRPHAPQKPIRLLAVGMMRAGDKAASYRALAQAMAKLSEARWRLSLVGDGPERAAIEAAFKPFGDRVTFHGAVSSEVLAKVYSEHDLFVWPAIREAYGMALLEAQAHGLAAIAGDAGGVPDIVRNGATGLLTPEGDVGAFAEALDTLLADPDRIGSMGAEAARVVEREHTISIAANRLGAAFRTLVEAR
jgi:glycosyltransferase involved in cell wall biosynthesis